LGTSPEAQLSGTEQSAARSAAFPSTVGVAGILEQVDIVEAVVRLVIDENIVFPEKLVASLSLVLDLRLAKSP